MRTLFLYALASTLVLVYVYLGNQDVSFSDSTMSGLRIAAFVATGLAIARSLEYFIVDVYFHQISVRVTSDLLRLIVSLLVYSLCAIAVIGLGFQKDITSLLATSAVLTVVAGFALQPTLGNFFSGVALEIEQPLKEGDYVRIDDIEGEVEHMKWRSIFIRSLDDSIHVLPNADLTSGSVEVFPKGLPVRCRVIFEVPSWVPPSRVLRISRHLLEQPAHGKLSDPMPTAIVVKNQSVSGSLVFEGRFYTSDYRQHRVLSSQMYERLWYGLHRENIPMAANSIGEYSLDVERPDFDFNKTEDYQHLIAMAEDPVNDAKIANFAQPLTPGLGAEYPGRVLRNRRIIDELDFLASLNSAERDRIAGALHSQFYAKAELVTLDQMAADTLYIIASGRVRIELEKDVDVNKGREVDSGNFNLARTWLPATLERITGVYTYAVGPIARVVVHDAAQTTDDLYELYRILAARISDSAARETFMAGAPSNPSVVVGSGTVIGMMSALCGSPLSKVRRIAITETEILCMPRHILTGILKERPALAAPLAEVAAGGHQQVVADPDAHEEIRKAIIVQHDLM